MAATTLAIISRFCIQLFSMLFNYLKLASSRFKWVLDFLLYQPFYSLRVHHHHQPLQEFQILSEEQVQIWRHCEEKGEEEQVDCAVCLSKIGEGDEVRVLRCEHVFHRDCLNQWVGFRNFTCPLCRDFLGSGIRSVNCEGGEANLLFFKFSSFSDNYSERDNWWLR
ncbi:RING-H2 finger protein ATL14-like [Neltuma alba]|uniref:RING-H2 finger protein ATL14-like n=1 Tax=Neltuma alba TaxID=207710 RepID=UPI0010A49A38|nr:RING-H2 finger protein ATL14-like [Prosopis alba]